MRKFLFWTLETSAQKKIRKEIMAKATTIALEAYEKEAKYQRLTSGNLNYDIISDLIKAAQFTGKVEIRFADGTQVNIIDGVASARAALDRGAAGMDTF
jgi:hypothetical protein